MFQVCKFVIFLCALILNSYISFVYHCFKVIVHKRVLVYWFIFYYRPRRIAVIDAFRSIKLFKGLNYRQTSCWFLYFLVSKIRCRSMCGRESVTNSLKTYWPLALCIKGCFKRSVELGLISGSTVKHYFMKSLKSIELCSGFVRP